MDTSDLNIDTERALSRVSRKVWEHLGPKERLILEGRYGRAKEVLSGPCLTASCGDCATFWLEPKSKDAPVTRGLLPDMQAFKCRHECHEKKA